MAEEKIRRQEFLPGYIPTFRLNPAVEDAAEDAVALPYDDPEYTCTKFGGLRPFFNPGTEWPLCKCCWRPQTFVGQVNMDDPQLPPRIRERLAVGGGAGIFQLFWWWVAGSHMERWVVYTNEEGQYCSPDDGDMRYGCAWRFSVQDRFNILFVTPIFRPIGSQSLTSLVARRIAEEIIQEGVPDPTDEPVEVHPLLVDMPEHLQRLVEAMICEVQAERAAIKQREYCIDSLKTIQKFMAFDSSVIMRKILQYRFDHGEQDIHLGRSMAKGRYLYFPTEEIFTGWEEFQVKVDSLELELGHNWEVEEGDQPASGEQIWDTSDGLPDRYVGIPCPLPL